MSPHSDHGETKLDYWEEQLKRPSLKEPAMKTKYYWLKPLTVYHALEFKGIYLLIKRT